LLLLLLAELLPRPWSKTEGLLQLRLIPPADDGGRVLGSPSVPIDINDADRSSNEAPSGVNPFAAALAAYAFAAAACLAPSLFSRLFWSPRLAPGMYRPFLPKGKSFDRSKGCGLPSVDLQKSSLLLM
jgi:hypothetical protein